MLEERLLERSIVESRESVGLSDLQRSRDWIIRPSSLELLERACKFAGPSSSESHENRQTDDISSDVSLVLFDDWARSATQSDASMSIAQSRREEGTGQMFIVFKFRNEKERTVRSFQKCQCLEILTSSLLTDF